MYSSPSYKTILGHPEAILKRFAGRIALAKSIPKTEPRSKGFLKKRFGRVLDTELSIVSYSMMEVSALCNRRQALFGIAKENR